MVDTLCGGTVSDSGTCYVVAVSNRAEGHQGLGSSVCCDRSTTPHRPTGGFSIYCTISPVCVNILYIEHGSWS